MEEEYCLPWDLAEIAMWRQAGEGRGGEERSGVGIAGER